MALCICVSHTKRIAHLCRALASRSFSTDWWEAQESWRHCQKRRHLQQAYDEPRVDSERGRECKLCRCADEVAHGHCVLHQACEW